MKKWTGAIQFLAVWPLSYRSIEIFSNLKRSNSKIFRCDKMKFQERSSTYCENLCSISFNLNFLLRHCKPRICIKSMCFLVRHHDLFKTSTVFAAVTHQDQFYLIETGSELQNLRLLYQHKNSRTTCYTFNFRENYRFFLTIGLFVYKILGLFK